ncbi:MAG: hypothetical protein M3Z98_09445 [Candidatus Dormibacteraeota bacterium]|nr:hypothetical protein [Candidatus Dormibacteraeota bacterium]
MAAYSIATGVLFFAAFFGIASGSQQGGAILVLVVLSFTAALVLAWAWVSVISVAAQTSGAASSALIRLERGGDSIRRLQG